jgi:hypothetical protein
MIGNEVDLEQTKAMTDLFMEKGFTYFDTAYPYINGKSEIAAKEFLVKRFPRDSFQLASKMPVWMCKQYEDFQPLFDLQLDRTGATYFDFYLLHGLDKDRIVQMDEIGGWDFVKAMKEKGLIKHFGFSFHDTADVLDQILTAHPEAEFVQLQINYADWNDDNVQSRLCYEVARKHHTPVIIMEPVKGGNLAAMTPTIQGLFKEVQPDMSIASWAIRYAASLEGVITVLSGMSTIDQLEDNVSFMADFTPLSDSEHGVIANVINELSKVETIPCTSCKYCVDDCPSKINIPEVLNTYNTYKTYHDLNGGKGHYKWVTSNGGKASDCIACGLCEGHCPQHIRIIDALAEIANLFES